MLVLCDGSLSVLHRAAHPKSPAPSLRHPENVSEVTVARLFLDESRQPYYRSISAAPVEPHGVTAITHTMLAKDFLEYEGSRDLVLHTAGSRESEARLEERRRSLLFLAEKTER